MILESNPFTQATDCLHRRQYVIGPRPILHREGWQCISIQPDRYLSHCPSLPVRALMDRDRNTWYLLGIAVETNPDRSGIATSIAAARTNDVAALYTTWSGRWILIGNDRIHLDACGFLACFYSIDTETWMSSSLALLQETCGSQIGDPSARMLRHKVAMQWYPLPRSRFSNVRTLLPSQTISLTTGAIDCRNALSIGAYHGGYKSTLDQLEQSLVTFLKRIAGQYRVIWISLTAGYDSRVLLAAAIQAGIQFKTFTFQYQKMKLPDRKLPQELANLANVDHLIVAPTEIDMSRLALFDRHTCDNFKDRDREFYARNYWSFCRPDDVILKAHCFEIARCHFWEKLGSAPNAEGEKIAHAFHEHSRTFVTALDEWIKWIERYPIQAMDWRDRFYYEQRLAGWCSADMQANDLIGADFLVPANAHSVLGLLLNVDEQIRITSRHQFDLIERMAPELLTLPINKATNLHPLVRLYWHIRYGTFTDMLRNRSARLIRRLEQGAEAPTHPK